jgi:ABC-type antimicrobial peptide transport system permease subunit
MMGSIDGRMMIMSQPEGYDQVMLLVDHPSNIQKVIDAMMEIGIGEYAFWTETGWINQQRETTETLRNLLMVLGIVSLIIAAIGIANTMVMAIYERTKEIGVMKVIGASVRDVRNLFLLEAAMIGAVGGVVGLGFSWLISYALNNMANFTIFEMPAWMPMPAGAEALVSFIPMWLYGLGFAFSAVVGLASGFWPAHRATRISALAAIRTE